MPVPGRNDLPHSAAQETRLKSSWDSTQKGGEKSPGQQGWVRCGNSPILLSPQGRAVGTAGEPWFMASVPRSRPLLRPRQQGRRQAQLFQALALVWTPRHLI